MEKPKSTDFPESGSIEYVDEHGNHSMIVWYPVTYYHFEHKILGGKSDVPLPDSRDRSPKEMPRTFQWVLQHLEKAKKVIGSTVPEIKETKKSGGKDSCKKTKRRRSKKSVG